MHELPKGLALRPGALPHGFALRALTTGDVPAAQALMDACESADTGEPCIHEIDLAAEIRSPRFDLEHNSWAVLADDGTLAGVGWLHTPGHDGSAEGDHYVRPDLRRHALDEVFLDLLEARAAELAREPAAAAGGERLLQLVTYCEPLLGRRRDLMLARGFCVVRELFQMRVDLGSTPRPARFPDGIAVRPARFGEDDRLLHAAWEEAFSEHYRHEARTFEDWRSRTVAYELTDPGLWLVAWDGAEVAGQVWAVPREGGAHVERLAVRKPWRGRGLGSALLLEVFRLLSGRGYPFARLFVDAQNETGAVDLYLKAGMRIERRFEVFEKTVEQGAA